MFCISKILSIKEPQTTLQNKETTVQSYHIMSNINTKKNPGIEGAHFNCIGVMGLDSFGSLNSSFSLFYFYLAMNLREKIYGMRTLTAETPPPHIRASMLLAGPSQPPPPSSKLTYYMDDPLLISLMIKILFVELFEGLYRQFESYSFLWECWFRFFYFNCVKSCSYIFLNWQLQKYSCKSFNLKTFHFYLLFQNWAWL